MFAKYAEISLTTVFNLINNNKADEITLPFNTEINGNHYYVDVTYDLGGFNNLSFQSVKRGYYLDISKGGIGKNGGETELFGGLRECINTVKRRSKKQAKISNKIWGRYFYNLVDALVNAKNQNEFN